MSQDPLVPASDFQLQPHDDSSMTTLDAEDMARELQRMALLDDGGGVTVPEAAVDAQTDDFTLCALGTFVTECTINFNAMRTQMANLWKPREVLLHEVDFWVHAYGFSAEFYSETVGKALGDAMGRFLTYDEYNMYVIKTLGSTSLLPGMDTDASREGAVEVVDDRKRRKGNGHDEADMEVDMENALNLVINNYSTNRYSTPWGAGPGSASLE
ncbi:hypothetical protein LINGRAHAP2_LOCUS23232 [Linum grandiflorum]